MPIKLPLVLCVVAAVFRNRADLVAENLALRHQLSCCTHRGPRPRLRPVDRVFWFLLSRFWNGWRESLAARRVVRIDAISCWLRSIRGAGSTVGRRAGPAADHGRTNRSRCRASRAHRALLRRSRTGQFQRHPSSIVRRSLRACRRVVRIDAISCWLRSIRGEESTGGGSWASCGESIDVDREFLPGTFAASSMLRGGPFAFTGNG